MAVYTVHQPPLRDAAAVPDAARFAFVRDGFSFWAFLFAPLWMLWHRMWLVLIGYLAIAIGLEGILTLFGASEFSLTIVGLFISLLVGLEASTLRRFTLRRRRWDNLGLVSGHDLEEAERRFFDAWLRRGPRAAAGPAVTAPPMSASGAAPRASQDGGVIGLFPEPGAPR
jgi:hypothetical protein